MVAAQSWTTPLVGLAANALLAYGAWALAGARRGFGLPRGPARWLGACVLFWAANTIGIELLSALGAIAALPILGWSALVAVFGLIARQAGPRSDGPVPNADAGAGPGAGSNVPANRDERTPLSTEAALALAVVLAAAAHLVLTSLFFAVKVVSDGPIYHLYFAARWWKAGRLALVAAPFGESAATYFPANGDLWFTWLTACWGGELWAKVGQAPFLLLAGGAAYACARALGAGRDAASIAACWFVASTPLLLFSAEANVDTIFIAGQMLAAYFLLRGLRGERRVADLALGTLAAGLALGTKAVGVVFVPPLLALALVAVLATRAISPRGKLARALVLLLVPMITCGYWFGRNLWLTGNPLYPLHVQILGRTILQGWYGPDAMRTSHFFIPVGAWRAFVDIMVGVLDARLAPIWLAALLGGWAAARRRDAASARWAAVFSALAVMQIALYWLVVPYRTQQRFMLQALGLAVVPLAMLLDLGRWARWAGTLLLAWHVLTPQPWPFLNAAGQPPWDLSPRIPNTIAAPLALLSMRTPLEGPTAPVPNASLNLVALGTIASAFFLVRALGRTAARSTWKPSGRPRRATTTAALVAAAAGAFLACCALDLAPKAARVPSRFYDPQFDFFPGWAQFEARCGPAGARVAYAGNDLPYYLLGERLRNTVRYVNINKHRDWLMHDYHREALARGHGLWPNSRPGWDRMERDENAWIANLAAEQIQLLVVTRVNPNEGAHNINDAEGFPIERAWADAHPERFQPLYGAKEHDPWFRLYRVVRPH